eukprot:gene7873-12342_t
MENNTDIPRSEPIEIPKRKTENIQEYMKNYKQLNKEKLNEKAREKHVCELCGGKYTTSGKYLHLKTKKHQKMLNFLRKKTPVFNILIGPRRIKIEQLVKMTDDSSKQNEIKKTEEEITKTEIEIEKLIDKLNELKTTLFILKKDPDQELKTLSELDEEKNMAKSIKDYKESLSDDEVGKIMFHQAFLNSGSAKIQLSGDLKLSDYYRRDNVLFFIVVFSQKHSGDIESIQKIFEYIAILSPN